MSDSALDVFEQRVREANLTEHQIFFFPKYGEFSPPSHLLPDTCAPLLLPGPLGFCETADQFHILNGEWCQQGRAVGAEVRVGPFCPC